MKLTIFAIFDKRAGEYSPPQVYPTPGVAERQFFDAVNSQDSHLNRHPEDYNMQILGEYETETGVITPYREGPNILVEATALVKQPK